MEELTREKAVFASNLADWRTERMGQFVLIHGDDVVDFFPSLRDAFNDGTKRFGLAPFLVQQITPADPVNVSFLGARLLHSR